MSLSSQRHPTVALLALYTEDEGNCGVAKFGAPSGEVSTEGRNTYNLGLEVTGYICHSPIRLCGIVAVSTWTSQGGILPESKVFNV